MLQETEWEISVSMGQLKLVGFFCQPDSGFQSHDPNQLSLQMSERLSFS